MDIQKRLQEEFSLQKWQVENTTKLIDEGNTIPFIARYRKELTGSLDDQLLRKLADRYEYLQNLSQRKKEVKDLIRAQEKLTDEIAGAIDAAQTLAEIEDIYRPFRPKRKTRASVAKERGLEPLALLILQAAESPRSLLELAGDFINPALSVETAEDALAGARDIIAEQISDDASIRKSIREFTFQTALIQTKSAKADTDSVYRMYYDYKEPVSKIPGHRVLAIDRGEKEEFLKVSLDVDASKAVDFIFNRYLGSTQGEYREQIRMAGEDSYERLIAPSIEREIRNSLTEEAAEKAISVFAVNLKQLLMQPPVKRACILGLDPAYRTGCKLAVIDDTGKVLDTAVIFPTPPQNKVEEATRTVLELIRKHNITVIAIGNGTASRESEIFVVNVLKLTQQKIAYMVVSEAGASVYSASKLAAEEFPEFDVSKRSAVSIARRLQDPLAELVKIDPQAIGVGQYQHDMPKKRLDTALGGVVEDSVNQVGVDLNTASYSLLSYVAGISMAIAKNIVAYRDENGQFSTRNQLLKVPKLGKKAFEQAAGFLRVEGKNILDKTGVHPESYDAAEALLTLCGYTPEDVKGGNIGKLAERCQELGIASLAQKLGIGEPTLRDIIKELMAPGRDPRDELPPPLLRTDVMELKDLKPGMELKGTVRNVIDFGAFVDIGVHEDGLVHISQICDKYIKHPSEVLKVGNIVTVRVLGVEVEKKRISLTMKGF